MGNTCASLHVAWRGSADDAARAISRAYGKLGYAPVKKTPADGDKHAVLLAPAGQAYVSVYDSDNATLDNGELKDLALAVSKASKTVAVFTSLYDSDRYEFIVFANGRQVDMLLTDEESDSGHFRRLTEKARATKWSTLFGRELTVDQLRQAARPRTAFADDNLAELSRLIGLSGGQPQRNYQDLRDDEPTTTTQLYFRKKPSATSDIPAGQIRLANYFDADHCRMRTVYPASWPIPPGKEKTATWLLLSQGAGFLGGTATIRVSGPDPLVLSRGFIDGCKFHHGQIVGPLEEPARPAAGTPGPEALEALLESKRFTLTPVGPAACNTITHRGEFPHLIIPSMTPARTTQILLVLQLHLEAPTSGEWEIHVSLRPGARDDAQHDLPPVRIAAIEQGWIPVVSGLNPKAPYNKSNLSADRRREQTFLHELSHKQSEVSGQRQLDHPAVNASVAILADQGQATLDACRSWLETWLRPLAETRDGQIRIHAERHMTAAAHVGKTKKTLPAPGFLADKTFRQIFNKLSDYQTVLVSYVPADAECAITGICLQGSLREHAGRGGDDHDGPTAEALGAMRGRPFGTLAPGATWHVARWVINHADCLACLGTSLADMGHQLDAFAAAIRPLQAWNNQCAWIPMFDHAESYVRTAYEEASVLNWFRGILGHDAGLNDVKMRSQWCRNVLRMVAPHMWLCRNLIDRLDRAALERVAQVTEVNGVSKIALRPGPTLDELELALLPILPVESARIAGV